MAVPSRSSDKLGRSAAAAPVETRDRVGVVACAVWLAGSVSCVAIVAGGCGDAPRQRLWQPPLQLTLSILTGPHPRGRPRSPRQAAARSARRPRAGRGPPARARADADVVRGDAAHVAERPEACSARPRSTRCARSDTQNHKTRHWMEERKRTTQGRDGRTTAHRHHTGILRRGV